ncbi:MAPEG family protein [Marinomonas ostreistagni]|uniref:MAPEG family protein n=1 Tax=Marinomonas ostreistagni TaxID=359209 RepID=UPI00194EF625|nr:MAPEG family protein [Marinomonas ostreistagni]MBM6550150.1 MAPEG family protein [Marinomonas ostreistagni]
MITPLYAAILALLLVVLSSRVIKQRMKHQVGLGDGGHSSLTRAIRVHGNFVEYVPFALLLIWMYEMMNGALILVHILGIALVIGRLLHAYGVSQQNEVIKFRQAGMFTTFAVLIVSAVLILLKYLTFLMM